MTRFSAYLLGALAFLSDTASAACTRDGLTAAAKSYITAQTGGKMDAMKVSADNFTYMENDKAVDAKKGIINTALNINYTRISLDTTACAAYVVVIALTPKPYVIGTQLRFSGDDTSIITSVDSIAATTGALAFNAAKTMGYLQAQDWSPLKGELPTRELLKKYGDGYLDMWTDKGAADSMKWGADCERVEGSSFTKPCGKSLPHGGSSKPNDMRRYVIDEQQGSVDVHCMFSSLGHMPDTHQIRVENGAFKYVHTITLTT